MILLTKQDALKTIILFIKMYCYEKNSNDAKNVLNSLMKTEQNKANGDELINWGSYLDCARKMILKQAAEKSSATDIELVSEQETFEAMILLLEEYYNKTNSDDLGAFLGDLLHAKYGETADDAAWEKWQECLAIIKPVSKKSFD